VLLGILFQLTGVNNELQCILIRCLLSAHVVKYSTPLTQLVLSIIELMVLSINELQIELMMLSINELMALNINVFHNELECAVFFCDLFLVAVTEVSLRTTILVG
jgi:IS4 transposase